MTRVFELKPSKGKEKQQNSRKMTRGYPVDHCDFTGHSRVTSKPRGLLAQDQNGSMLKIQVCTSPPYVLLQKGDQKLPRNIEIDRHGAQMGGLGLGAVVAQRPEPSFQLLGKMPSLRCNHANSIDERAILPDSQFFPNTSTPE